VALKVFPQAGLVVVFTIMMLLVPQVSLAPGSSNVHGVPHSTTLLDTQVIVGGVLSNTVTVCVH
jgi:hypothetical protein